jgi:hypothetical protein
VESLTTSYRSTRRHRLAQFPLVVNLRITEPSSSIGEIAGVPPDFPISAVS